MFWIPVVGASTAQSAERARKSTAFNRSPEHESTRKSTSRAGTDTTEQDSRGFTRITAHSGSQIS